MQLKCCVESGAKERREREERKGDECPFVVYEAPASKKGREREREERGDEEGMLREDRGLREGEKINFGPLAPQPASTHTHTHSQKKSKK